MKSALLAGLASFSILTAPATREADELRVVYPAGAEVVFEERGWRTLEGKEAAKTINGEDASEGMRDSMPQERVDTLIRFTTWLDEVEDGRPVGARRRFDELMRTFEGEEEKEEEGVLAGRTVLLSASAGNDQVTATLPDDDEGPEVDEVYLSNHRLAFQLERYFPGRAVEVGDTWELDEAAVRESLDLDRQGPRYFQSDNSENQLKTREASKVSGSVEYKRREELEGVACAVLRITLSAELSDADVDPSALGQQEGMESSAKLSLRIEGEEHLWFALEAGRPVRSQGEWAGELAMGIAESNDDTGLEVVTGMVMEIRGGFEQSWTFADDEQ